MTARPEVVELLLRTKLEVSHPENWTYIDSGQPLTPEDIELAGSATVDEFQAVADRSREMALQAEISADLVAQLRDLVMPYFDAHPECTVTQDLFPHMTTEDVDTFRSLARALKVMDEEAAK